MDEERKIKNIDNDSEDLDIDLVKSSEVPVNKEVKNDNAFSSVFDDEGEGQLAIDVYQTKEALIIEAPIAGVTDAENLDVSITNESVTIKGKREREMKIKEDDYFYQECYWGRFSRSIILPQEIDPDKAEATIRNGILIIKLPKLHRQKTKKLRVKFG